MIDQIDEVMNCDEIWSEEFFGHVQVHFLMLIVAQEGRIWLFVL